MTISGVVRFNVSNLRAKIALINTCNVKPFDALIVSNGVRAALDVRPYTELLNELGVFYTVNNR